MSKTKQRERPKGCIISMHKLCHRAFFAYGIVVRIVYLHRRGAFSVARFDILGNAKTLTRGTSRGLAPRFFIVYKHKN